MLLSIAYAFIETVDPEPAFAAGEFDCVNSQRYARNLEDEELPGLDRFYYSNGFGLLYDTSSFISVNTPIIIRRLDSYQIQ